MDYVLAFVTLIVVFIVPAAIIIGLVAQPEKKPASRAAPQSRPAASTHPEA